MKLSAWCSQDVSRQRKLGNWPQSFVNSGWSPHSSPTVNWLKILQVWFSSVAIVRANLINLLQVYTCKSLIKRYGKTGNKIVTLLQNELKNDVERFYRLRSNLLCKISDFCSLQNVVAESRELFYFLQQNAYMLRVLPARVKLLLHSKWRNSGVWRDSRLILSSQKSVFKQLCCLTGLSMGGKTRYIAFN